MVNNKKQTLLKLPPDMRAKLEQTKPDIESAKTALQALKDLGQDTTDLEEKLKWADKAVDTLLNQFS
jgi:hypothetical protein